MSKNIVYSQTKNSISVAASEENGIDQIKKQIKSDEDYETILAESLQISANGTHGTGQKNASFENVDHLLRNLLDASLYCLNDQNMSDLEGTINSEKQLHNQRIQSTTTSASTSNNHHLYPNASINDDQNSVELERIRKFNIFLIRKIQYLRDENKNLVDKSKAQLSTIRADKSHEEQLNSMRSQLAIQNDTISGLKTEANLWKSKYEELNDKHKCLIDKQSANAIEFKETNKMLNKRNDDLEVDNERCVEVIKDLELENKRLNNQLFHATSELEQMKKTSDSCDLLRKDRVRSQQKCHVIAEKLEVCKGKLEQSTNLLKEKSCLVEQQNKEIKDLNVTLNDLKKANSLSQLELEKSKLRIDDLESRLKSKDDLVKEYKLLYNEIRNTRENEIKHEQQTIKALVMINSRYECELSQIKSDLEKLRYDQVVQSKRVPDLIEDNAEHDRLSRLKKKYNILNRELDDSSEVYESIDEILSQSVAIAADATDLEITNGGHNGYHHRYHNGANEKEALKSTKLFQSQNGNSVINSATIKTTDLNGSSTDATDCTASIILTATASPI